MGKPEADWKQQHRHVFDWLAVVVAVLLVIVYLSVWLTDGQTQYFGITMVFVAWLVVFFTDYWQPILYLLMALVVTSLIVFWLLSGVWNQPITQAAILLKIVFLLLIVYLYTDEERGR